MSIKRECEAKNAYDHITSTSALEVKTSHSEIISERKKFTFHSKEKPMEDYRLPAPLVGMRKATNLTGMPNVQTDLRATKISVTFTWDLATSAPKKPKKQPAKKKPSKTSTSKPPPTSQCQPPETPTNASYHRPTPSNSTNAITNGTTSRQEATSRASATAPTSSPTPQSVTKPLPARQPFTGEYQVEAVKANYLRNHYTNHADPNNGPRDYSYDGDTKMASVQALRPKTGPRHTHYLINDWVDGSPEYYLLTYKDTLEYDHYKRICQQGEKSSPEETKDWTYFCTTGDILLL